MCSPRTWNTAIRTLRSRFAEQGKLDVPEERRFVGFDAYKKAMDALKPGDVVILTTPPGFRWVHFTYAIEKGLNVFMEKPVTVDGPSNRRMLALNEQAKAKDLKVAVGLMCVTAKHAASCLTAFRMVKSVTSPCCEPTAWQVPTDQQQPVRSRRT